MKILREILYTLLRIEDLLEDIQEKTASPLPEPALAAEKPNDPDAWLRDGIANILGFQPGKKGDD